MKIIILGAGGIGSLVGALLSKNNDVLLIGRKTHVNKINKNGLEISGCVNKNFKIKAKTRIDKIDNNTLIILTTKVIDNKNSINEIKNLIKKDTVILCLQNGLGGENIVENIVDCKVLRGITTAATTFLEPGKVKCYSLGNIYLEKSNFTTKICSIFNNSNLQTKISEDIKNRIWKKLIVNCVMNTLTAIFNVKNEELIKYPDLIRNLIHELILVANKEGLNFNENEFFVIITNIIQNSKDNKSSMLQDVMKGRKTEIDYLNGKIIKLAEKHELEIPINQLIVKIINFMEKKGGTEKPAHEFLEREI